MREQSEAGRAAAGHERRETAWLRFERCEDGLDLGHEADRAPRGPTPFPRFLTQSWPAR